MAFSLLVLNGSSPGTTVRLDSQSPVVTIGRHTSRELQLDDERSSRLHARVFHRAQQWNIEDCGSLNGTMVNSQPVQQTVLEPGDLIRIGERLILFVKNPDDRELSPLQPTLLRSTTLMGRVSNGDQRGALVEQSLGDSMSRVVRDSAVLCRLATQLHRHSETDALIRDVYEALVDGIGADEVSVWLVGPDGRLRCAGRWGEGCADEPDAHVLASLAVEKDKAILIEPSSSEQATAIPAGKKGGRAGTLGTAVGVPIPGQKACRGAIECHRLSEHEPFESSDLDFTVVVAHQAGLALENLEHRERLEQANEELRQRLASQNRLVGSSQAMQDVLDQIARVGPTASTVLILGESGTGKELVAKSVHDLSRYSAGPCVNVNCAAFTESLLESELFGHEAGAFTGADRRHIGQFERAHRGTIFLDEVGEMSMACQAKLLRLLEGHPFQRVGGQESIHVDVRVISATHRDLPELVQHNQFREDLYFRLRVIDINVPPLRQRDDDVIELACMFLEQFRRQIGRGPRNLSQDATRAMRSYSWPGNVRELKNAVERAVVLGRSEEVSAAELGLPTEEESESQRPRLESLREAEQRHIHFILQQVEGNKTQACRVLGIGRGTLYAKLEDKSQVPNNK